MKDIKEQIPLYLHYCRLEKRLSSETLKAYSLDMRDFQQFLHQYFPELIHIDVDGIDKTVIKAYVADLNSKFKAKTVKRKLACLRSFYGYLEENELCPNPFHTMNIRIKEPTIFPVVMTLTEVRKILRAVYACEDFHTCNSELLHMRDVAVLEILFATGIRVHELCGLTLGDYSPVERTLKIMGKGQKERHIFISNAEVADVLDRYIAGSSAFRCNHNFIFLNKKGMPLSCQAARDIVAKYRKRAKLEKNITPHAFRHTFASLLLEEGVDIKYIQEFLGHSSISTTQIYLHISDDSARNVLRSKHPREKLSFL